MMIKTLQREPLIYWLMTVGILCLLPLTGISTYVTSIIVLCLLFGLLASSWDLLFGYTGLMSFGHAGFFGVSAYASVLIVIHTPISAWLALVIGPITAGLFGLFVGVLCLRLRGPYLTLTTLAFAQTVRLIAGNWISLTGGPLGLSAFRLLEGIPTDRTTYYYIVLGFVAISIVILRAIADSNFGLRFQTIRDDEILAEAVGIDITRYKVISFSLSAFFAGVAGSLYAFYTTVISPLILDVPHTIQAVAMAIVGGTGTIFGPLIGGLVINFLTEYFRIFGAYRLVITGAATVVIILFFPKGIWQLIDWIRFLLSRRRREVNAPV